MKNDEHSNSRERDAGFHSSPVVSSQLDVHEALEETVRKHVRTKWQHNVRSETRAAVVPLLQEAQDGGRPLLLDVGCGTGLSSVHLAEHRNMQVLAVDQSAARLNKAPAHDLVRFIRADAADVWCLAAELQFAFEHVFLLYPNPWPKPGHLKRRWHGHPALPLLLQCAPATTLRTNWEVYAREWHRALELCDRDPELREIHPKTPFLTRFEEKYARSGHTLFEVVSDSSS